MTKKNDEKDLPEFGYTAEDEAGVLLVLKSNAGKDKNKYLENAKKFERPLLISIESVLFDTYRFKNFAMTIDEAKDFCKELERMIDYLED